MLPKIRAYEQAARRGAEWLLTQQTPDGSFVKPDLQADVYHKAVLALAMTGHTIESNRLLSWIAEHDLGPDGRLRHFDAGLALYKTAWICQGAHRMGRFDLSMPIMEFILTCQAEGGGFVQWPELGTIVEPVCTSWAGVAALTMGRREAAEGVAGCLQNMIAQQPDPMRFYTQMEPGGTLLTGPHAPFVDATQPEQGYYNPGIAMLFFARMYLATGDETHWEAAEQLMGFFGRCTDDVFAYPTAGKSAVAAALMYAAKGEEGALQAALSMGDYLVGRQDPEGWWANPHSDHLIVRLDHTAEFVVFLTDIAATLGATVRAG